MTLPLYLDDTKNTEEAIRQRMLDRVPADVDKTEGSYVWDSLAPVSMELVFVALLAKFVLEMGFGQTSSDEYLTYRTAEHGVIRRPAVAATGVVSITGTENSTIPAGVVVATEGEENAEVSSIQFVTTQSAALDANGLGTVAIEAVTAGTSGNVPANRIVVLMTTNANIKAITNTEATTGGIDVEDDDTLRDRYLEKVRNPGTSGNIADYKQWAKEISGVTEVHVLPIWNGPGTVKVIILGPNKLPPETALVQAVQEHIAINNLGDSEAPIGATVTVAPAEALPINVVATILLDSSVSVSVAEINENFTTALKDYLAQMAFKAETVRFARIGSLLIEQAGVLDYVDLAINGGDANIPILQHQVATFGSVTIHV